MTKETFKKIVAFSNKISKTKAFRWSYRLLFIFVFVFVLYGGWKYRETLIPYIKSANPVFFLATILFYAISLGSGVFAWILIISLFNQSLSWITHTKIYFLTLVSRRLPGTIWYIGGRAILYRDLGLSAITITIASTIEWICTIISGCIIGILMLVLGTRLSHQILILTLILLAILGTTLYPNVLTYILKLLGQTLNQKILWYQPITWVMALSVLWLSSGIMVVYIVKVFQPVLLADGFRIIGFWSLSGVFGLLTLLLPSSFAMTELSLTAFLSSLVPVPIAAAIAIITRVLTTLFEFFISFMVIAGQQVKRIFLIMRSKEVSK